MKLNKEENQKVFLGIMLLIGVVYCYNSFLLEPLLAKEKSLQTSSAALEPKTAAAQLEINNLKAATRSAPQAEATLKQLAGMIPDGSPMAWFPTRIGEILKCEDGEKVATRLTAEIPDKRLGSFRKVAWTIEMPKVDTVSLGLALARLENEEPLLEVKSISLEANRDDVGNPKAVLVLHNIVK